MRAPSQSSRNTISSIAAVGSSCIALAISFLGVAQFDLPITKYVRSVTIHLPWDQLTVPWMAFTSDMGDWIGQGWRLTAVSLLLLVGAWAFEKPSCQDSRDPVADRSRHRRVARQRAETPHRQASTEIRPCGRLADDPFLGIRTGLLSVGT